VNAEEHADRIAASISSDVARALVADPVAALERQFGLTVREVPSLADRRGAQGWCDGLSFIDQDVVLVVPSPFSRRANFTTVHELAHRLILEDDAALDWLANQSDPDRNCEQLCDLIAARLLLPAQLVSSVLGDEAPRAGHIAALYAASQASEPVCAIALGRRVPCQGAVLVADIGGPTVTYASVRAPTEDGWPVAYPWPSRPIPTGHPLLRIIAGQSRTEKSWWSAPWGERQDYYLDAIAYSRRLHAILSVQDLWGASRFHVGDTAQTRVRPERSLQCGCGYAGVVRGYPCSQCGTPYCPSCKECRCERQRQDLVDCPNPDCYMKVMPHQIRGGRCVNCE
jgi:Zn-dependent peptidase ImmA (M78 family)